MANFWAMPVVVALQHQIITEELKTYLCNTPLHVSLATLARISGMRWPIETCFEESKQHLGMSAHEARSWHGWHHHMTLCILLIFS